MDGEIKKELLQEQVRTENECCAGEGEVIILHIDKSHKNPKSTKFPVNFVSFVS